MTLTPPILIFPFCSPHLSIKKWPFYNELIELVKKNFSDEYKIVMAPGPNEIKDTKNFNTVSILDKDKALNISQLASLIKDSSFIIANDTGPAHIASHLNKKGLVLFGSHTSAKQVSIENSNFKSITVKNLNDLDVATVLKKVKDKLN